DVNLAAQTQTIDALGNTLSLFGAFQNLTGSAFGDSLRFGPTRGSAKIGSLASSNLTQYTAGQAGDAGNAITIAYVVDASIVDGLPFVTVANQDITVHLAPVGNTAAQVAQAVTANPAAHALVTAQAVGRATGFVAAVAPVHLVVINPTHVALFGGAGDDTLVAANGHDVSLFGGDGNDSLVADGGSEI